MITKNSTRPGDMTKFAVIVDDKDITDAVTDAQIYQEIFSPHWTCDIIVLDTTNLLMTLPIRPGSKVVVSGATQMNTPADGEKDFYFIVSSIADKTLENTGTYSYTLVCVDESMLKQQSKRISKGFTDKKVSDIIKTISEEYLDGEVESSDTDGSVSLIIPNLSPLNACAWLTKMATKNNAADFWFYQKDKNKFAFKTFEDMFSSDEESVPITLTNAHTELRDEKGDPLIDYMLNIGRYHFEHFDGVSNMASGFYKNKLVSYDMINKKWESKTFTFGDDCPEDAKMKTWENPLFDDSENASISFKPKHPGMFQSGAGVNDNADVWQTSRKSSVQKADQERLIVQIPGSIGAWEWLGKNIQVDLPSQEEATGEKMDKYRKGRYVVVCVAHMMSKAAYAVNLELVKKRLNEKQESSQV